MARRRANTTKNEIIQLATKLFLEEGYSATTPKMICDELDISTGNLTYYFPTKEHLLAVLVEMLCAFQQKSMQEAADAGSSLRSVCMELAVMTAMAEESEIARSLFIAAYSSAICLEIIRENDTQRAKQVFGQYCADWTDDQYTAAEILVSGIEFATLMAPPGLTELETLIEGALNSVMMTYNVPEELRTQVIGQVLATDYRRMSRLILKKFKSFVEGSNGCAIQQLLNKANE